MEVGFIELCNTNVLFRPRGPGTRDERRGRNGAMRPVKAMDVYDLPLILADIAQVTLVAAAGLEPALRFPRSRF
jgi:hypothetical protein